MRYRLRGGWRSMLELRVPWAVLFLLVATWSMLPYKPFFDPQMAPNTIATSTLIADRDLTVEDLEATSALQQRAQQDVLPVYDLDRSLDTERRRQLALLFEAARQQPQSEEATGEELASRLSSASLLKLNAEQATLLRNPEVNSKRLEERLIGAALRLLRQGMVANRELLLEHRERGIQVRELPSGRETTELDLFSYLEYPSQARDELEEEMRGWNDLDGTGRRLLADMVLANLSPNLNFNSSATLERRRQAKADVGAVTHHFGKGEVIVRKWARVDELQAQALSELAGARDLSGLFLSAGGILLLLAATLLLLWLAVAGDGRVDRTPQRLFNEVVILLTLAVLGARGSFFVASAVANALTRDSLGSASNLVYAIPYAALALTAVLLYNRNIALVASLVFALIAGHATGGESLWPTMVFCLASCLAAVFAIDRSQFRQRSMMTRAGLVVGAVNVLAALTLQTMSGRIEGGLSLLGVSLLWAFAGGLLTAAVSSFAVPICETLFSITTYIKLIELANPNLPLLRRLAFEAPGTFQHSLAVANLAKSGVEAIDGDSVLVHTTALYHDIGKIVRPQYFIENQPAGQNPHDSIQPSMSALILINHVKEGVDMARDYGLPMPIVDAIEQHHGTRLIKFFYSRAKERCDPETEEIREEEFRYGGPKPKSKEMGVLMLADAVEAASRTLVEPTRQKIRNVLKAVFSDCLDDNQLDQTDLTLGDLRRVEDAFMRVLTNIYHRRVDYPGFDFNRGSSKRESRTDVRRPMPASGGERGEQRRRAS